MLVAVYLLQLGPIVLLRLPSALPQVDGCHANLMGEKRFYRRSRCCKAHALALQVLRTLHHVCTSIVAHNSSTVLLSCMHVNTHATNSLAWLCVGAAWLLLGCH